MKRKKLYDVLILVAACWATDNSSAQENSRATNAVSLNALVAEAQEKNPELKFYEAEFALARAARRNAGLLPNPELGASVGEKSVRERNSALSAEGVAWSASVSQPFEWPGRIGFRKAIANRDVELAELGLERFRTALGARIRSAAFGLFVAQEKAAAAAEVSHRFRALREVLVQRDPAGITPLLETRVIEATELTLRRKSAEADLAVAAARLELNQLRGLPLRSNFWIAPPQISFSNPQPADVLLASARTNNFELRIRAVELAQQGFRVDLARNERFPAVAIGPSISEERAGDRERIVGVGVSLPLPLWNRNTANIDAAKARQIQAETSLYVTQREVERKVLDASQIYQRRLAEMAAWRPDSVQQFKEAAALADRHYRLGAVPIATYVELQKQYLEAVEGLLNTRREAIEAAGELHRLTGVDLLEFPDAKPTEEKP